MNPILAKILGSFARWALGLGVPFLVKAGIWTPTEAEEYVAWGTLALVGLMWSLWEKYKTRLTLVTALATPEPISEATAKKLAAQPDAPSVATPADVVPSTGSGYDKLRSLLVIAVVSSAMAVSACASSQKQRVVTAYQATESALAQFQDAEIKLYEMKTITSLNEETHKKIHAALAKAFDAQEKVGSALLIWQTGGPAPSGVSAWMDEAKRVLAEIRTLLPDNDRVKLVQMLVPWIEAIIDTVRLLGIQPPQELTAVAEKGGL